MSYYDPFRKITSIKKGLNGITYEIDLTLVKSLNDQIDLNFELHVKLLKLEK